MNYYLMEKIIATRVIPGIVIALVVMEIVLCSRMLYVWLWNRKVNKERAKK